MAAIPPHGQPRPPAPAEYQRRILIVEDDDALREMLLEELRDQGYEQVQAVAGVVRAWTEAVDWQPDVVVSDLRLPDGSGAQLLEATRQLESPPAFIVITAFGSIRQAVDALREGADDFLTKPLDLEHFHLSIRRALRRIALEQEVARARQALAGEGDAGFVARSPEMRTILAQIEQIAFANGPVLILGESGVGKELAARAVHARSERSGGPFVAVNCGAIPEDLLEAELFGHSAGAYTGAQGKREGLFVAARGGTFFLDEIGDMPPPMQTKLLRALEENEIRPLGSDRSVPIDVRLIAATNRPLAEQVEEGDFRADLYYRLETFEIRIPPLRERPEDLDVLAARFLNRFAVQMGKDVETVSEAAISLLHAYPFPGNVRELRNVMERAVTFCTTAAIQPADLPPKLHGPPAAGDRGAASAVLLPGGGPGERILPLAEVERAYIQRVLDHFDGNKRRAAEALGIGRRTLYRKLEFDPDPS